MARFLNWQINEDEARLFLNWGGVLVPTGLRWRRRKKHTEPLSLGSFLIVVVSATFGGTTGGECLWAFIGGGSPFFFDQGFGAIIGGLFALIFGSLAAWFLLLLLNRVERLRRRWLQALIAFAVGAIVGVGAVLRLAAIWA